MQEMQEVWVWTPGQEDPLEQDMATHSGVLAWRIPGTEEPGGLPSTGLHRVGHDWSDLAAAKSRTQLSTWQQAPCKVGQIQENPAPSFP